jgi:hypothetical protein
LSGCARILLSAWEVDEIRAHDYWVSVVALGHYLEIPNTPSEVDRLGQRRHAGITFNSQQFGMLWIHGNHLAAIGAVNKIPENRAPHASFAFRRADHGNRRRCEETFKSRACTTRRTGYDG